MTASTRRGQACDQSAVTMNGSSLSSKAADEEMDRPGFDEDTEGSLLDEERKGALESKAVSGMCDRQPPCITSTTF